jgi:hypothetical protein
MGLGWFEAFLHDNFHDPLRRERPSTARPPDAQLNPLAELAVSFIFALLRQNAQVRHHIALQAMQ